jgi:hypothetical protein
MIYSHIRLFALVTLMFVQSSTCTVYFALGLNVIYPVNWLSLVYQLVWHPHFPIY